MVCIRDQSLEGALAYSLNKEPSFTSRLLLSKSSRFQIEDISARIQVSGNRLGYRMARVQVVKVIELPSLSCWREVRRCTQCIPRAEKGNVAEEHTPDFRVVKAFECAPSVALYSAL